MNTRPVQLAFALLVAAAMASCASPERSRKLGYPTHVGDEYVRRPQVVKLFIGGAFGASYEIFSDGFTVRYKAANSMMELPETKGEVFTPDLIRWKKFLEVLDKIKAWEWKPWYRDLDRAPDGTTWQVIVIDYPERQINSVGGKDHPASFEVFLAAAKQLIGGRRFE